MRNDNYKKVLNLLGLANKAGKLVLGSKANKNLLEKGIYLILISCDAGPKFRSFFLQKGEKRGIPVYVFSDSIALGLALGFPPVKVVGFKDASFASAFLNYLGADKEVNSNGGGLNE